MNKNLNKTLVLIFASISFIIIFWLSSSFRFLSETEISTEKDNEIIAETIYGKVKGYEFNGIKFFRGIPYGANTDGENRFMPPKKPEVWSNIKDCTKNGPRSPQGGKSIFETNQLGPWFSGGREDRFELSKQPTSEDCLNLNVLTPSLEGKRPVMVYFHGGGFQDGGGLLAVFSDRHVKEQDVVLVGVNHRLNVFGYTYLGGIDDKYKIGNPGQLDLVASLEWVRDNISNFGGDPNNVMIFGESGGGAKVSILLSMPSAKGLFNKAAIMSGASLKVNEPENATASAKKLMKKLGVTTIEELLKVPTEDLFKAGSRTGPVLDGYSITRHPFFPDAPEISSNIPILIGSCKDETTLFQQQDSTLFTLDEKGLFDNMIKSSIPEDKVNELIALYKRDYPEDTPSDIYFRMVADRGFRSGAIKLAELKLVQSNAKVWMYYSQYDTPIEDGKLRAFHTYDLPLTMRLTLVPEAEQLSRQMSAAWAAFARNGNPSTKELPWPEYSIEKRTTMIFDVDKSEVVDNPNEDERKLLLEIPSRRGF